MTPDDSQLAEPEAAPSRAEPESLYNFRLPPRVSKDRKTALETVYGRYAKAIEALLTSRLRTASELRVASIEQSDYATTIATRSAPASIASFRVGDGEIGFVDLGLGFAFHLVDRLLGGPGDGATPDRPLTPLEDAIVLTFVERAVSLLADAWQSDVALRFGPIALVGSPDALPPTNPQANVLVAEFDVKVGPFQGPLTVSLPAVALEAFLQEDAGRGIARPRETSPHRSDVAAHLGQARVQIAVRLPKVSLPARALTRVSVGDVLHLGHTIDTPVDLLVNGRLHAVGVLGQQRGRVGLRVTRTTGAACEQAGTAPEGRVL
ncbi:MAG: FliM/FliN family flagellar motor switch protein [Candidatus Eisenbacteria bacterium]